MFLVLMWSSRENRWLLLVGHFCQGVESGLLLPCQLLGAPGWVAGRPRSTVGLGAGIPTGVSISPLGLHTSVDLGQVPCLFPVFSKFLWGQDLAEW